MIGKLLRTALVALLFGALGYAAFGSRGGTGGTDARTLVANGARLVDVRTTSEFASGHLEGAVNVPVQDLERRLAELEPRDRPIVLYCRSGNRSARAARVLRDAGFTAVHDLGPMSAW